MVAGAAYAIYAAMALPLGTLNQMGPGMFPIGLGVLLAIFGLGVLVPAFIRDEAVPAVDPRVVIAVLASLAVFALLITHVGLFPSVVATTLVGSLAIPGRRLLSRAVLCAVMLALTWVIFSVLLSLQIPLVKWSF
jgi:hypothetical protein